MRIFVNNKEAKLKQNFSFEYITENPAFTRAEGYSLAITFPLKGCPENIDIFGHLHRKDVVINRIYYDCEIIDTNFHKFGVLAVVGCDETEVKGQFLEGLSEQNYIDTFEYLFVNEMQLCSVGASTQGEPETQWDANALGRGYVALPWVNQASGNIQNDVTYDGTNYHWADTTKSLSFQPNLLFITKKICENVGYKYNFAEWEKDELKAHFLICNTLPAEWGIRELARALPHWSVKEWFEKLGMFLDGVFYINHSLKEIDFKSYDTIQNKPNVSLGKVVDKFSVSVSGTDNVPYIGTRNIKYKDGGHFLSKYYSCDWFFKYNSKKVYETVAEIFALKGQLQKISYEQMSGRNATFTKQILYAKDVDTNFILRSIATEKRTGPGVAPNKYNQVCVLQPLNVFGNRIIDEDDDNYTELEFVPVCIADTDIAHGNAIFLDLASFQEEGDGAETPGKRPESEQLPPDAVIQPPIGQRLDSGEKGDASEYYTLVFLAWYDGSYHRQGKLPCPAIDWVEVSPNWELQMNHMTMRINSKMAFFSKKPQIDTKKKYSISFISDSIPDVNAVFFINSKKYLCEKIVANFSPRGMSQLLKGTFYQVKENL